MQACGGSCSSLCQVISVGGKAMRNETLSTQRMYIRAHLRLLSFHRKYATILFKRWFKWYLRRCRREAPQVVERARSIRVVRYRYEIHDELKLHALVKDPDGKRYNVQINYSPGLQSASAICTCSNSCADCEHKVALAQAFIRSGRPPKPELP